MVKIFKAGNYRDERGVLSFANSFKFTDVSRFYIIHHPSIHSIRAWQGHPAEKKFFYVVQGAFILAWVQIDDWINPSVRLKAESIVLKEIVSPLVEIPAGYANGLKAVVPDSKLLVFSEFELNQSIKEKIRFPHKMWFDWENLKSKY